MMKKYAHVVLRSTLVAACAVWGFYFLAMWRTSGFGSIPSDFLGQFFAALIYVAPLAIVPFIGLGAKKIMIGVFVICSSGILCAEVFGWTQERLVVRKYGEYPAEEIQLSRWWPFEHHAMFGSKHGWDGSD